MSMSSVKFEACKLQGTGKQGILTPDSDGYRTTVLGGLNTLNSAGQYYTLKGAELLFMQSSAFMRRVKNGCLKIEVEHPKRTAGMTEDDYIDRLLTIDMKNVCGHISEIWLDPDYGKQNPQFNNPDLVAILGKVRPSGEKASMLENAFANPRENVCFSIRAFTKNYRANGRMYRELDTIVTFDYVNEGGIEAASKWSSPVLESLEDRVITERVMKRILERTPEVSMEDSRHLALEVLRTIRTESKQVQHPLYAKWN